MAIAFSTATSAQATNAGTITVTHPIVAGSDRFLFVGDGHSGAVPISTTSVSFSGTNCTQIWNFTGIGFGPSFYINSSWRLINPPITSTSVIVSSGSTHDELVVGAISFTGVHQTTPLGTAVLATGSSQIPTVNVTSSDGSLVVDNVYTGKNSISSGNLQTLRWRQEGVNASTSGGGSTEAGTTTVTMSWTMGTAGFHDSWLIGGVSINPSAVAAQTMDMWFRETQRPVPRAIKVVPY